MYKAAVRWMIRRNVAALNRGDYRPVLGMYAADATLTFPGDNSWSRMYREPQPGRAPTGTYVQNFQVLINSIPSHLKNIRARLIHQYTISDPRLIHVNNATGPRNSSAHS